MTITEIFPNPTVKIVIFQIRFPNLLSMEKRVEDYQIEIMGKFPESSINRQQGNILKPQVNAKGEVFFIPTEEVKWEFKSEKGYKLSIDMSSLTIESELHKTYNNPEESNRFRDIIEFAIKSFLTVTRIPIINRIGLRYIDHCPIKDKNNASFEECYNSVFPVSRFNIEAVESMIFEGVIKKNGFFIRYIERFEKDRNKYILVIDTDAYMKKIDQPGKYLDITDKLHEFVVKEYETTIKEPVYSYMRKGNWI